MLHPLSSDQQRVLGSISHGLQTKALQDAFSTRQAGLECLPLEWRNDSPSDMKAKRLLEFFKREFFTWINEPPCESCGPSVEGEPKPEFKGTRGPRTPEEIEGMASRVEMYECKRCGKISCFPRYNHPATLMKSRRGRCGEWANCFCALAVSAGFNTRFVLDLTDHVWAEIFSPDQSRWVHCDPCENVFDAPLMYEEGWNKELSWIFAFENGGLCRDVTRRYSRKWDPEMLQRRLNFASIQLTQTLLSRGAPRWTESEQEEFKKCVTETISAIRQRKRETIAKTSGRDLKPEEARGRTSGSEEWRRARGEIGDDKKEFQVRYQLLIAQGKTANEAAVTALKEMIDAKSAGSAGNECKGPTCTTSPRTEHEEEEEETTKKPSGNN